MLLKRLELFGFKSFARPTTLTFTTPITAIVGPNGSGKSNIAEGVRFVLGEQSIKSLRGKRGEDLIFNGTHSVSRQNKASVAIVFDNSKRSLNVDYDEVSIKRIVHRDSTSEYLVNGSRVRLKDILEMLSAVHIGASSHHIISQGEADRILLATPKDRRSMVEDALGLKIYHYKKSESERKLEKTSENLSHVKALRKEIEPHLRFLEKQVVKIQQAEHLREELKNLYKTYFTKEHAYLEKEKSKLDEDKKGPEDGLKKIETAIKKIEASYPARQTELSAMSRIFDIEKSIENARQKKEELSRALGKIEGIIEYEERGIKEEESKSEKQEEVVLKAASIAEFKNSLAAYSDAAEIENDVSVLRKIIADIKSRVDAFFITYVKEYASKESIAELKKSVRQKQFEKERLAREIERVSAEEQSLHNSYTTLRESAEKDRGEERENERQLFALRNKKTELVSKIELLRMREEQYDTLKSGYELMLKEAHTLVGPISPGREEGVAGEDRAAQEQNKNAILRIKIKLEEIGVGGGEILKEYREVKDRDEFLEREITDLEKSAGSLKNLIADLNEKIEEQFKAGIQKINKQFQELFTLMFGGGKASLRIIAPVVKKKNIKTAEEIVETEDYSDGEHGIQETEEGLDISISLPRKKIKGLMMLSGGERALTSIALIFAMTQVNPPPFLILDETDAALDEVNSRKYGEMLNNLAKETELILITHNRETMTHAEVLYGVTAIDGVSRLLSVKFDEAKDLAQEISDQ